jgi:hypothetical protein
MSKLRVEVLGGKPPKPPENLITRLRRALNAAKLAALHRPVTSVFVGFVGFVLVIGTPHLGWDYQCRHAVWGSGSCQEAVWCEYFGVQGRRVIWPERGEHCHLIGFLPLDFNMLIGRTTR